MESKLDMNYRREASWLHALVVLLARKHINRVCKIVLSRAFERSQIDSYTLHEMAASCDRILWPDRFRDPGTRHWVMRDRNGWPVERIKGRPITNCIRLLLHTSIVRTWKHRHAVNG